MSIQQNFERQYPLVAYVDVSYADLAAGVNPAIELPGDAIVIGGDIVVTQVFNSTTNLLDIGDGGSANRYANDIDLKVAARTALTITGFVYSATDMLDFTYASTGAAAGQGSFRVTVHYIRKGRGNENQG
jgi:hypothetical protein